MEADLADYMPCSSIAVDSVLRMSSAGVIWGACYGPFDAERLGLSGSSRASYIAKTVGKCGFYCGLFAGIFSFAHCGIQRYRRRKDWVNTLSAGVVAGAAFGAGTRNWKQVAGVIGLPLSL
ncbi:outer envelope pore protein 16-4, chloroplastic isoform X2 [Salvia miltiorrhiza]|uniref:outer envelope pore protein 16-4, chloroplastic isoform X2 n=1 Tax=Salvia miltiorrhiza TaxID=226208 RepID=UPI0025AD4267|nr:outer envelope pore protein 16-4, chloroplastic isoform X2 [Salvia miltiorrhiza]